MTLGNKIRAHRKALGLTQAELGAKLGVQLNAVSKWECGRVEDIPTSKIKALASIFNVPPSYLIDDDQFSNKAEQLAGGELSEGLSEAARELLAYVDGCSEEELRQVADYVAFIKSRRKE